MAWKLEEKTGRVRGEEGTGDGGAGGKQGRPKRGWMDAVREGMQEAGVEIEDTKGQEKWRARKCCGDPE